MLGHFNCHGGVGKVTAARGFSLALFQAVKIGPRIPRQKHRSFEGWENR